MIFFKELQNAPLSFRGLSRVDSEGNYFIYVNANLSDEAKERTIQHEMSHIQNGDLEQRDLTGCEAERRNKYGEGI
ncbi:MAG: ImmA/IrrE family metallo-endopeptidase [Oscillospiraceae bacterium]|nr:ImmA/IrrE family metallo-endopeptidase [Oscillospiraceae bacterium]